MKTLICLVLGAALYYAYDHLTTKDIQQARTKAEKSWKASAPIRDKAGRAIGAATDELKK